MKCIKLWDIKS